MVASRQIAGRTQVAVIARYAPLLWLPAALLLAGLAGWLVALGGGV